MSRLLFAAARGARIQFYGFIANDYQWVESGRIPLPTPDYYRIHPEDAHLAYGPISSALRTEAEDWTGGASWYLEPFIYAELNSTGWHHCREADDLTRSLFLLILAEALADEGL